MVFIFLVTLIKNPFQKVQDNFETIKWIVLLQIPLLLLYLYDQGYLNIGSGRSNRRTNSYQRNSYTRKW